MNLGAIDNSPLVCICIPCYNNENTVIDTLNSIHEQTYKNLIVKIFDNGSTDASVLLIKEWVLDKTGFHLFENGTNIGAEQNFNKCFDNAEGKYLAVFHSDDVYHNDIVEKQVAFLEKNKNCSAVSTLARRIDGKGNLLPKPNYPQVFLDKDITQYDFDNLLKLTLEYGNLITCPSVMARTEIIQNKIKNWRFDHFATSSDLDVWLRLAKEGGFGVIKEYLMSYRSSEASYSFRTQKDTKINDLYLVLDFHLAENPDAAKNSDLIWSYNFKYNQNVFLANIRKMLLGQDDFFSYRALGFNLKLSYFKYLLKKSIIPLIIKTKTGHEFFSKRYL